MIKLGTDTDDKAGNRYAKGRPKHQSVIEPAVLVPGCSQTGRHADANGQAQADAPQGGRYGKGFGDDVVHRAARIFIRRAQIQHGGPADVIGILFPERVVQMVSGFDVFHDSRRQLLFLRKGASRYGVHQPEGNRNNSPQHDGSAGYALQEIYNHAAFLLFKSCPSAGKRRRHARPSPCGVFII